MIVVRYATLVALVVWLAAMMGEQFGDVMRGVNLVTYACGAATVVGLFVMKFMGPPPRAFILRAAIAVIMLALTLGSTLAARGASAALLTVNLGLGLVLLTWYIRE
jgi:hypothetical protein